MLYQMISVLFAPSLSPQLEPLPRFPPSPFHSTYILLFPLNALPLAPLYFPSFCASHTRISEDLELGAAAERDKIIPHLNSTS